MSRLNTFLSGVRVIDLSRHLPGPLATLLLADMGAEVIKIESPQGDELRTLGPTGPDGVPRYFSAINAGKSVCRMDLKSAEARDAFLTLAETSDVVVESFRPGVMTRLGIGYSTLRTRNPKLIYCSLNGYGATGELAQTAGHDLTYLALAGALHRHGLQRPLPVVPQVADNSGALFAVISILGALRARERDGKGCEIDVALADAAMPLQAFRLAELGAGSAQTPSIDDWLGGGMACYNTYQTADSRCVALGALEPKFWEAFCHAAGHPEWTARQRASAPQHDLIAEVSAVFGGLTLTECIERFGRADCCFSPVLDLAEAVETDYHRNRGVIRKKTSGGVEALFPVVVDGEPPGERAALREISAAPPLLGV